MDTKKLKSKIDQIDKETYKIFCDVCEDKDISAYKSMLLNTKLEFLESKLETTLVTLLNTETAKLNKLMKYQKLILVGCAIAFGLLFVNPIIGIIAYILNAIGYVKFIAKETKEISSPEEINGYIEKANQLETLFQNCRTFLTSHTNYDIEYREEELENNELRKIDLANEHLEIAFLNMEDIEIPEEIQEIMVKMLQMDLETDERDLSKLMQMAIEKELSKINKNNGDLTRIRRKKEEN